MSTETTIPQLNKLAEEISALRQSETQAKYALKQVTDELDKKEATMLELLVSNQLPNYRSPVGLFSLSHFTSVRTPKTPEAKALFYAYLEGKGLKDDMLSVNSATLNSFFKEELAMAEQLNADVDPTKLIPGLTEVTLTPRLSFRK